MLVLITRIDINELWLTALTYLMIETDHFIIIFPKLYDAIYFILPCFDK